MCETAEICSQVDVSPTLTDDSLSRSNGGGEGEPGLLIREESVNATREVNDLEGLQFSNLLGRYLVLPPD